MADEISQSDCNDFRKRVRDGENIRKLSKNSDYTWRRIQKHIIGKCDHDGEESRLSKEEAYSRFTVNAEDCRELRLLANESDDILSLSEKVVWNYQTVLSHVRGHCKHDNIDIEALEIDFERSQDVTTEECEDIRELYFDDRELIRDIADSHSVSYATAERHIKFLCAHEVVNGRP